MLKRQYRLIGIILPLALVGFVSLAPEAFAQKTKTKVETVSFTPPTVQISASPNVVTACAGEAARVQLDAKTACFTSSTARYIWSASGGRIDRKSTRLNSSHIQKSRMPSSA